MKEWKMILYTNGTRKQARVVKLIPGKTGIKTKLIRRDKEGYFILIKGRVY